MKFFTLKGHMIVVLLSLFMVVSLGSCKSNQKSMASHGWTDLNHAKKLDKLKGKRLKKIQKNVTRAERY